MSLGRSSRSRRASRLQAAPVARTGSAWRSIVVAGHKTSVSLEDGFWKGLKEIAWQRDMALSDLALVDQFRAATWQPVISHSSVRTRVLPPPNCCRSREREGITLPSPSACKAAKAQLPELLPLRDETWNYRLMRLLPQKRTIHLRRSADEFATVVRPRIARRR
jgi:predicted DNA-binding ribbon-helix-helix protein